MLHWLFALRPLTFQVLSFEHIGMERTIETRKHESCCPLLRYNCLLFSLTSVSNSNMFNLFLIIPFLYCCAQNFCYFLHFFRRHYMVCVFAFRGSKAILFSILFIFILTFLSSTLAVFRCQIFFFSAMGLYCGNTM